MASHKTNKKTEHGGMSFAGAVTVCMLLIVACTLIVIFRDGVAQKVGLGFTVLLMGGLGAYLLHFLIRGLRRLITGRRPITLEKVDVMDGEEFEEFCAGVLMKMGFSGIEYTRRSADQGTDILAWKDDLHYAVQCKRYDAHVGNKAVQEAFAGKTHYGCDVAVVMTNSYFTPAAWKLAETTGVILWDREFFRLNKI